MTTNSDTSPESSSEKLRLLEAGFSKTRSLLAERDREAQKTWENFHDVKV